MLPYRHVLPSAWRPALSVQQYSHRPERGALIALNRQPYRVRDIIDIPPESWSDRARSHWTESGSPTPWGRAPFEMHLTPAQGHEELVARVEPWHRAPWHTLPEHYAVCASCGELAPCRGHREELEAAEGMRRLERDLRLLPGCCPGCQEPITTRQRVIAFPGVNVLLPTGEENPRFHLRSACRAAAERYEDAWVRADPTRKRSLLTLRCAGSVVVHSDGSRECFGAVESDCPSVYAHHNGMSMCWTQSHGCPRECPREWPDRRQRDPGWWDPRALGGLG